MKPDKKGFSAADQFLTSVSILDVLLTVQQKAEFADRAIKTITGLDQCGFCLKGYKPSSPISDVCPGCTMKDEDQVDKTFDCPLQDNANHRLIPLRTTASFFGYFLVSGESVKQIISFEHLLLNFLAILTISMDNLIKNHDLKKLNLTLQKSEEIQRNLFEFGGIGIALYDLDGRILMLNQRAVRNLGGTDARQFLGKTLTDLFGKEVGGAFVRRIRDVATTSKSREFEDCVEMPNGTIQWYSSVHTRLLDPSGNVTGVHVYAHDITEPRQAETVLRESNEYLENLLNYANAPIIVWDPQFRITRFNHAFEFLTGRSEAEVVGQSLEILFPPALVEASMTLIRKTLTGERWETVEIKIIHRDGSVKTLLWNSATLFTPDGQTPVATIAQGHDITERKKAEEEIKLRNEQLQALNAEKDKFFSILAHDLRSPFSAFLGFTQMIAEEMNTMTLDQIQQIALSMRKSATNLYNLLDNLLEWSRLQRGITGFQPTSFTLITSISECLEPVKEFALKKEIEIKCDIPAKLQTFADLHMIQTIIRNLVSNAVKYTAKGGRVELLAKTNHDKSLEITVKDNGIGMNKEMIVNLFHLDQNTNRPGTEGEPSTGLGLIICKEFIEKHGGKIWVESSEGEGSAFHFTLPGK